MRRFFLQKTLLLPATEDYKKKRIFRKEDYRKDVKGNNQFQYKHNFFLDVQGLVLQNSLPFI